MKKERYIDHKYDTAMKQSIYVPARKRHIAEQAKTLGICLGGYTFNDVVIKALELYIDANINEYNDRYDDWPEEDDE